MIIVFNAQVEWYQTSGGGGAGGGGAGYSAADEYAGAYFPAAAPGGAEFGSFDEEPPLLEGAAAAWPAQRACSTNLPAIAVWAPLGVLEAVARAY